jgi:L-ascorbate metabolism protein UlaG (beta-lactamase superfamily)
MKLKIAALALALAAAPLAAPLWAEDPADTDVKVRWFGQACFELKFPSGLTVMTDPFDGAKLGKYILPKDSKPDVVTISHEHFDHSNDKGVAGSPEVLRGLTSADAKTHDWKKHDTVKKGVRIRTVGVYHDTKQGAERGKNAIFIFEPEKKGDFATIAHLGDLGHVLTDEQVKEVGPIDALLIPVGGKFTIDAAEAKKVVDQLKPSVLVIPMHYKTDGLKPDLPLVTADAFLELFSGKVKKEDGNQTKIPAKADDMKIVVLDWKQKETDMKGGSTSLQFGEAKAWINAQPGVKEPELHMSAKVTAEAGGKGGKLLLTATLDKTNLALEDEEGGAQPEGGFKLAPGKKQTFKIVLREGQKGAAGASIKLTARLTSDGASSESSTTLTVQEVK